MKYSERIKALRARRTEINNGLKAMADRLGGVEIRALHSERANITNEIARLRNARGLKPHVTPQGFTAGVCFAPPTP